MDEERHLDIKNEVSNANIEQLIAINSIQECLFAMIDYYANSEYDEEALHNIFEMMEKILRHYFHIIDTKIFIYDKWNNHYKMMYTSGAILDEKKEKYFIPKELCEQLSERCFKNNEFVCNTDFARKLDLFNETHFYTMLKLKDKNDKYGIFVLEYDEKWNDKQVALFSKIFFPLKQTLYRILMQKHAIDDKQRYQLLYAISKKVFSSMEMDEILKEIISALNEVYPTFDYLLLLTHEQTKTIDVPVQYLTFSSNQTPTLTEVAYFTGEIQCQYDQHDKNSVLYVPLKGKQGTYGVLEVKAPKVLAFPEEEIQFISLLANTVGNALENAQLYQQSRQLISDLQLINDTSRHLNSNYHLKEIGHYLDKKIKDAIAAEDLLIVLYQNEEKIDLVNSLKHRFNNADFIHTFIEQLDSLIRETKESILYGDVIQEKVFNGLPYRSLLVIPMQHNGKVIGFIAAFHQKPYQFSFDQFKLLQAIVYHSTLAFTNAILHSELERMVITDHLTGLYARKYLNDVIKHSIEKDKCGSFLLIDIDNFKLINDTYGHQVGDEVLIQVSHVMQQHTRKFDVAARWGGEELAIYLPNVKPDVALRIAERLVKVVPRETNPSVTISCGVSFWNNESMDSVKELFLRADDALYQIKESGKNRAKLQKSAPST